MSGGVRPRALLAAATLLGLAACGGQSSDQRGPSTGNGGVPYTAGVFQPYSSLANQCSTAAAENNFLRSWVNDTYLWYSEVPDLNPNSTSDPLDYFDLLRTSAITPSGADKDKFHFTYDTDDWIALSQSGVSAGYGAQWFLIEPAPPREVRVAYVDPNTPAAAAGVQRGDLVVAIDGADAINGDTQAIVNTLNAGLFPDALNESHQIRLRPANGGAEYTATLVSQNVTSTPVQNVHVIDSNGTKIGYILFNDHIATAEAQLIAAVNQLKNAAVTELVLDIRYNGGGYLYIASELSYMIAGSAATAGKTFERLTFNAKYPSTDPITGRALAPEPFYNTDINDVALPVLNLSRVFVLTGSSTCSASESIINGLRGAGVNVVQIGGTTCGKPYGFYPQDNCGTTYFAIQFKGVNEAGFGDYTDGFSPDNTTTAAGTRIPGCSVRDDFAHALGDAAESRLAAALTVAGGGVCPSAPPGVVEKLDLGGGSDIDGIMIRSPLRENRILGGRAN
ncbi:MAG TPA: S41 family peptidase [Povalibacter sp.]